MTRSHLAHLALLALGVLACPAAAAAHPFAMVMFVPPNHEQHRFALGVIGTGGLATSFDGASTELIAGGGLAATLSMSRGFQSLSFAGDARVRVLATGGPHPMAISLPVDLLARVSFVSYGAGHSRGCGPQQRPEDLCLDVDVHDPAPLVPYLALGATVVFALSPGGDVRAGPILVGGCELWIDSRVALYVELETRLLLGGANASAQLGLNVGVTFAP